jgi:peptide-methionine (R)-S-oxide reductase
MLPKHTTRRAFLFTAGGVAAALALRMRSWTGTAEAMSGTKEVKIVQFSSMGQKQETVTMPFVMKTDAQWKQLLSPDEFEVTRRAGTERPFTGRYWNLHDKGLYRCVCCGTAVFSSETKFESGTGWPSFWEPIAKENVRENLVWSARRSPAGSAMATWGTFSTTAQNQPGCAIA